MLGLAGAAVVEALARPRRRESCSARTIQTVATREKDDGEIRAKGRGFMRSDNLGIGRTVVTPASEETGLPGPGREQIVLNPRRAGSLLSMTTRSPANI